VRSGRRVVGVELVGWLVAFERGGAAAGRWWMVRERSGCLSIQYLEFCMIDLLYIYYILVYMFESRCQIM
jgi:hypothetical protein